MKKERKTIREALGVTLERVRITHSGDTVVDTFYIVTPPGDPIGSTHYSLAEADAAYLLAVSNQT